MNKQIVYGGVAALVVVILGGFFLLRPQSQSTPKVENTVQPEVTQEQPATGSSAVQGQVVELTVSSEGLKFTPNSLQVKEGDTVKVTYKNTKGSHNFVIDEFNVKTNVIDAGKEETVEFVANKKGSFEFYCGVPGHRAAGMKGTLVVE